MYFGTDVGKGGVQGAGFFFLDLPKRDTPCVYTLNAQIFVENSNMG